MPTDVQSIATAPDEQRTIDFLAHQLDEYGANLLLEPNVWALLVVRNADASEGAIAREILASAPFPYEVRESEDDSMSVYCVDGNTRAAASFWLVDIHRTLSGRIRNLAPAYLPMLDEILSSTMPHRIAKNLGDLHSRGEIVAGAIRKPDMVRSLLDRLHVREPLYVSAFLVLLEHNLIDLVVLNKKLEKEDVELGNDLTRGSVSRDPFFQARQTAASEIRNYLTRCQLIDPISQQRGSTTINPYEFFTAIRFKGDDVVLRIDGLEQILGKPEFLSAIRRIRKNVYRGSRLEEVNTDTPWMTEDIGYPLRFVRQQMSANPGLAGLDLLYMMERAVDPTV